MPRSWLGRSANAPSRRRSAPALRFVQVEVDAVDGPGPVTRSPPSLQHDVAPMRAGCCASLAGLVVSAGQCGMVTVPRVAARRRGTDRVAQVRLDQHVNGGRGRAQPAIGRTESSTATPPERRLARSSRYGPGWQRAALVDECNPSGKRGRQQHPGRTGRRRWHRSPDVRRGAHRRVYANGRVPAPPCPLGAQAAQRVSRGHRPPAGSDRRRTP